LRYAQRHESIVLFLKECKDFINDSTIESIVVQHHHLWGFIAQDLPVQRSVIIDFSLRIGKVLETQLLSRRIVMLRKHSNIGIVEEKVGRIDGAGRQSITTL